MDDLVKSMRYVPKCGLELPQAALAEYMPRSIYNHLARPQFALRLHHGGELDFMSDDESNVACEVSEVNEIPSRLLGQKGRPLWGEMLSLSLARFYQPEADRFNLTLSATFGALQEVREEMASALVLFSVFGERQGSHLTIDHLRVSDKAYWPTPLRVQKVFNGILVGSAYILESQQRGETSDDYLPHLLRYIEGDFSRKASRNPKDIALLRARLPDYRPSDYA